MAKEDKTDRRKISDRLMWVAGVLGFIYTTETSEIAAIDVLNFALNVFFATIVAFFVLVIVWEFGGVWVWKRIRRVTEKRH